LLAHTYSRNNPRSDRARLESSLQGRLPWREHSPPSSCNFSTRAVRAAIGPSSITCGARARSAAL